LERVPLDDPERLLPGGTHKERRVLKKDVFEVIWKKLRFR
jgi:hypothetical protein